VIGNCTWDLLLVGGTFCVEQAHGVIGASKLTPGLHGDGGCTKNLSDARSSHRTLHCKNNRKRSRPPALGAVIGPGAMGPIGATACASHGHYAPANQQTTALWPKGIEVAGSAFKLGRALEAAKPQQPAKPADSLQQTPEPPPKCQ
jgi:hypothetical protein